jgi:hypothetical protein
MQGYLKWECKACIRNGKILEFEQLPEELKWEADYYDKDRDLLIYCERCNFYGIIEGD